jgi:microsomal dipeptidase-like Zn-dependent dipeptidase
MNDLGILIDLTHASWENFRPRYDVVAVRLWESSKYIVIRYMLVILKDL